MSTRNTLFAVIALSTLYIRWISYQSILPKNWTPDSTVRITALLVNEPEHNDTKTIIRLNRITVKIDGFAPIRKGQRYSFTGIVKPEVLMGKTIEIEMINPAFLPVPDGEKIPLKPGEKLLISLDELRNRLVNKIRRKLPEPQATLAAGILLGTVNGFPLSFYQAMTRTGVVHITAASGYNVTAAAGAVMIPLIKLLGRLPATVAGIAAVSLYVGLSGASPSVVRAGIMASLVFGAYGSGRPANPKRLLWVAAYLMLLMQPTLIVDTGLLLSLAATAGLLYGESWLKEKYTHIPLVNNQIWLRTILADYLSPSIAASIFTMPIILWKFGQFNLFSPLINLMILPLVPLIMALTVWIFIPGVGTIVAWAVYVPLTWIVKVIEISGSR